MTDSIARSRRLPAVLALRSVRVHLAACIAGCIAAAALALAADRYADVAARRLAQARAELDAVRAQLAEEGGAEAIARIARYRELAARGAFAASGPVDWAEALAAAAAALHVAPPTFEIGPPQPLDGDAGGVEAASNAHAQVMRFAAQGLHEQDLLRLLQSLRGAGAFRVEDCRLQRAGDEAALAAECTLRWLAWPRADAQRAKGAS